jgi:outer membrane immunogenic protein
VKISQYFFQCAISAVFLVMSSTNVLAAATSSVNNIEKTASWSGFYIGAQLGKGWNRADWQYTNSNYFNTHGLLIPNYLSVPGLTPVGMDFDLDANGMMGGGNIGFNYQHGSLILGLEAAILDGDFKTDQQSPFFSTDRYTSNVRWFSTVKGRIGYAYRQWLIYINGGWAGGDVSLSLNDNIDNVYAHSTQWANGWTVGAGIDYKMTEHFSLGVAYDYIQLQLNNAVVSCADCNIGLLFGTPMVDSRIRTQSVMARLTYFINP